MDNTILIRIQICFWKMREILGNSLQSVSLGRYSENKIIGKKPWKNYPHRKVTLKSLKLNMVKYLFTMSKIIQIRDHRFCSWISFKKLKIFAKDQ